MNNAFLPSECKVQSKKIYFKKEVIVMKFTSKKGFTLVELVVVIAILGILAAIAIPSVVGIIQNAQNTSNESNAKELDSACKDFYAGVSSGQINEEDDGSKVSATLPSKTATVSYKKSAAKALTINSAVEYAALSSKFDSNKIQNYGFISKNNEGTIVFWDTAEQANCKHFNAQGLNCTFDALYNGATCTTWTTGAATT